VILFWCQNAELSTSLSVFVHFPLAQNKAFPLYG
jgi:hypothetical protein